jgi:hypothetical protein
VIQFATAGAHDADSEVPLEERLTNAALVILDEQLVAKYEKQQCSTCPGRIVCPAIPAGRSML